MDKSTLADIEQRGEVLEALVISRHWSEEHRRRFEEDGHAMTHGDAVEAFCRIGARNVDLYPVLFPHWSKDPVLLSSLNMICEPGRGCVYFREPAVRAIVEGFERAIAEDSNAPLYILHDGKAEPREVSSWERFLAYQALRFFVENVPDEDRNGAIRDCFDRAEAILDRVTVNRPPGRHAPVSTAARNERICTFLHLFQGCGLPVTSLDGPSLASAMAEAWTISENVIAKAWQDASPLVRPNQQRRVQRCASCGEPAGEGARRDGDGDLLCRACRQCRIKA